MRHCLSCGSPLSVHSQDCPRCGSLDAPHLAAAVNDMEEWTTPAASLPPGKLVPVARFSNSAEAGYFADVLEQTADIVSQLTIQEHFDALTGRWRHDYVLSVDESQADRAARQLGAEIDEGAEEEDYVSDLGDLETASGGFALGWVPILLTTLAAGSVAYWGIRKIEERPRPPVLGNDHRQRGDDLWQALSSADGPWMQQIGHGPGIRVLRILPNETAVMHEDRDGDGRFEREYRLQR